MLLPDKKLKCISGRKADLFCRDEHCKKEAFLCKTCPCVNEHFGHKIIDGALLRTIPGAKGQIVNTVRRWKEEVLSLISRAAQKIVNLRTEFLTFAEKQYQQFLDSDIDVKLIQEGLWDKPPLSGSELNRKLEALKLNSFSCETFDLKRLVNIEQYINRELATVTTKIKSLWDSHIEFAGKPTVIGLNYYKDKRVDADDIKWSRSSSVMLWECDLTPANWTSLLKELSVKQEVRNLCLSNCTVGRQAAASISKMRNIEILDLTNNQIDDWGVLQLSKKLIKMRELLLNTNQIGDDGFIAIVNSFPGLVKLELSKRSEIQKTIWLVHKG